MPTRNYCFQIVSLSQHLRRKEFVYYNNNYNRVPCVIVKCVSYVTST